MMDSPYLHDLPPGANDLAPPARFTFPFYYRPHPLAVAAAEELQRHLREQQDWEHDFGIGGGGTGSRGKMFGVLVVRTPAGELRYLAAYSGKLAESNRLPGFVPPVYDLLDARSFYREGERAIERVTEEIEALESSPKLAAARQQYAAISRDTEDRIAAERALVKEGKARRKRERQELSEAPPEVRGAAEKRMREESIRQSYALKDLTRALRHRESAAQAEVARLEDELRETYDRRARMSNELQQRIFSRYTFLNRRGEVRDVGDLFRETVFQVPPAGAGECAAPKLLQFAYRNGLQPIVMAEFWWGQSPASAIRRHGHYYPACRGKCEPILGHMLQGLEVDPDPMLDNPAAGKQLTTVYEDEQLLVVDKPADFLSVPGKHIRDSVWLRIRQRYPAATGPLIVHRLDMSTSGLLLVAKTKEAHKVLQRQFHQRTVRKRYVALVSGAVAGDSGTIDLPLRGDLEDRPRQIVCHDHGKAARTHWEVIARYSESTLLHLWPVTGRTHQLRVHCAHPDGLGCPIVDDDLYGRAGERLQLHAETLSFRHPVDRRVMSFTVAADFTDLRVVLNP